MGNLQIIKDDIVLDFYRSPMVSVYAKQDDTGRVLKISLQEDGIEYQIPAGVTARISSGTFWNECTIQDNKVLAPLSSDMLYSGRRPCQIELMMGADKVSTANFILYTEASARDDNAIMGSNKYGVLDGLIDKAFNDSEQTGKDAAQTTADRKATGEDRTAVATDRRAVEKINNDFTLTAQQAVADVNNAGQTQTQRVNTAGDTQVSCIQAEGTTQVQNVQATAAEIAADREQIHTNRDNTARLQRISAGAITRSAEGSFITLEDAADGMGFRQLEIPGETRQVATTGAQLIDFEQCLKNWKSQYTQVGGRVYKITALGSGYQAPISFSTEDTKVTLSGNVRDISGSGYRIDLIDSAGNIVGRINKDIKSVTGLASKIRLNFAESGAGEYSDIMLNTGDTALPWEPYTGAAPSPSPEYPQEMKNVGKLNEQTGKYEVTITSCNKNTINVPEGKTVINNAPYYVYGLIPGQTYTLTLSQTLVTAGNDGGMVAQHWIKFMANDGGVISQKSMAHITFTKVGENVVKSEGFVVPDNTYKVMIDIGAYCGNALSVQTNYCQLEMGGTATEYIPHRGHTVTVTSDRPLTKWDKLTCRDGVWGWAYGGAICGLTGTSEIKSVGQYAYSTPGKMLKHSHISCSHYPYSGKEINDDSVLTYRGTGFFIWIYDRRFSDKVENTFDIDGFKTFLVEQDTDGTPVTIEYQLAEEEWVPLSPEEQAAMNALCSYAGTTHIWTDDPLHPVISLDYTVDTVKYIGALEDRIAALETAQAQTTAAFSYLPPEIQAAMIENETRDLLSII